MNILRHGKRRVLSAVGTFALTAALAGSAMLVGPAADRASAASTSANALDLNKTAVPDFNVNAGKSLYLPPAAAQLRALDALKANLGDASVTARWDKSTGSVDTIMDFASAPSQLDPEAAARSFVEQNAALFGLTDGSTLRLKTNTAALGGHLLYFEQTYNGIPVEGRGVGVVMDGEQRVKAVSGPYQKNVSLNTTPSLDGAAALAKAQADLAKFKVRWASGVSDVLNPALDKLASQLGAMATPKPHLSIFPTATGPRLTYKFYVFSRNPFGFFKYHVDAATGEVLYREDTVRYQTDNALPLTADVYPTYPCITPELKDQAVISVDPATGIPCGQLRIGLRKFDPTNVATGVTGELTGTHALINETIPAHGPFPQAAKGT
ncbi:MAG TPA: hypothetical protein VF521_15770, partial [Pyrinomonadaceae bacterium]